MPTDFRFQKSERLCSKKAFEFLFNEGKSIYAVPLKLIFTDQFTGTPSGIQVAFGVSKKNFKRAVKRNYIKRMLREIYRQHKPDFSSETSLIMMVIYSSKEIQSYRKLESSFVKLLNELKNRVQENT